MLDLGTVRPGSTLRIPFSSFDKDDGSAITMTNFAVGDILVYKDGNTTERASTAGFTATTDFDGKTGKHLAIIDLADNTTAGFWNAGSEYLVAIDSVTIDTVTTGGWVARFRIGYPGAVFDTTIATLSSQTSFTLTVGPAEDDALNGREVLIHDIASAVQCGRGIVADYTGSTKTVTLVAGTTFTAAAGDNISIMDMSPLLPTVIGRTLDVSSTGEAGVDWANVGSQGTTVNLSATTTNVVNTATAVTTVNGLAANVITAAAINTGAFTAAKFAAGAIDAAALAADAGTEIATAVWASATRSLTILDEDSTTLDLDATIRAAIGLAAANLDTQIGTLATAANLATLAGYVDTEVAAILAAVDTEVAAIKAITDQMVFTVANRLDVQLLGASAGTLTASALATDAANEIADALLDRDMSTGTDSGSSTVRTVRQALRALRNRVAIATGTVTVYKENDSTSSWTGAVTTAAGDPISEVDPAGP